MTGFCKGVLTTLGVTGAVGILCAVAQPPMPPVSNDPASVTYIRNADKNGLWVQNSTTSPIFTKQLTSIWQYEVVPMSEVPKERAAITNFFRKMGDKGFELTGPPVNDYLIFRKSLYDEHNSPTQSYPSNQPR